MIYQNAKMSNRDQGIRDILEDRFMTSQQFNDFGLKKNNLELEYVKDMTSKKKWIQIAGT